MASLKLVPFDQRDKALAECAELLDQHEFLPRFSRNNDKLDSFYFDTLKIGVKKSLAEVTKAILTLSHVEEGP